MNPTPFSLLDCKEGLQKFPLEKLGRFRWVSTSIVRFDPVTDWPPDLCLRLVINQNLETYDGMSLTGITTIFLEYETRRLTMSVFEVLSKTAVAATGGNWDPYYCPKSGATCFNECPMDGMVKLQFSHAVVPARVLAALKLNNGAALRDWVVPCSAIDTEGQTNATDADTPVDCVAVMPRNLRSDGAMYQLMLPKNSRVTALGGTVLTDQKDYLKGVLPFKFRFKQTSIPNQLTTQKYYSSTELRPRYRRYRLYLRHGLQSLVAAADANQVSVVATAISACFAERVLMAKASPCSPEIVTTGSVYGGPVCAQEHNRIDRSPI